jgi:hypothetical protein
MIHGLLILGALYLIARFALGIVHILLDLTFVVIVVLLVVHFMH